MGYSWQERFRINQKAKRKVAVEKDSEDDFMEECIQNATDNGMDDDEAEAYCESIWEDISDEE